MGLFCGHDDEDADLLAFFSRINVKDSVDYLLRLGNSTLHIIINKKRTASIDNFDVYVYDGNFLKSWLDNELHSTYCRALAIVCNGDKNNLSSIISSTCHGPVLEILNCPSYFSIIDCMYGIDTKSQYLNTVGSLVINREVDRCLSKEATWQDDAWCAFTFFLSLCRQMFMPSPNLFNGTLFPLEELCPCREDIIIRYEKKYD